MKTSELIAELQKAQRLYGDLEIIGRNCYMENDMPFIMVYGDDNESPVTKIILSVDWK